MATTYTVTVPDGTTSATDGVLADEVSFTTTTWGADAQARSTRAWRWTAVGAGIRPAHRPYGRAADHPCLRVATTCRCGWRLSPGGRRRQRATSASRPPRAVDGNRRCPGARRHGCRIEVGPGTPSAGPATTTERISHQAHYPPLRATWAATPAARAAPATASPCLHQRTGRQQRPVRRARVARPAGLRVTSSGARCGSPATAARTDTRSPTGGSHRRVRPDPQEAVTARSPSARPRRRSSSWTW